MLKLFKEIRKTGDATVGYPFTPLEMPAGFRGKPEHNEKLCIACAACAIACPANAITMELDAEQNYLTWDISYGRCIFCGRCQEVCPLFAIELTTDFELAVTNKEDLRESCSYGVAAALVAASLCPGQGGRLRSPRARGRGRFCRGRYRKGRPVPGLPPHRRCRGLCAPGAREGGGVNAGERFSARSPMAARSGRAGREGGRGEAEAP